MERTQTYPLAAAVRDAYRAGEDDETMEPLVLVEDGRPVGRIEDGDYVIFYNIRGEREIQLTRAFVDDQFPHFEREPMVTHWTTMIEYHPDLDTRVAFPPPGVVRDTLSETVSRAGRRQVKIVESEKQVHLTTFLNGGREEPFPGEARIVVDSVDFEGYLPPPAMRAEDVAEAAIRALQDESVHLLVVNWANVDVIGHGEDRDAIMAAVSAVDTQLGRVLEVARAMDVTALVTADHGTVEKWYYPDGSIDTGHTDSDVPFVLVAPPAANQRGGGLGLTVRAGGSLIDVAPTVLALMGIQKPPAMTGTSLVGGVAGGGARRVALLILDGWGARDEEWGNLIAQTDTPVMDGLLAHHPAVRLQAAGEAVGLPDQIPNRGGRTVGNSEVGHVHIGAGRIITSDRLRIERSIEDGSFFQNPALLSAMEGARDDGGALHLLGIISFYSSHGSVEHLKALLRMAKRVGVPRVYVHGMLGRRGEKPESGAIYVADIEAECRRLGIGRFVSLIGRFWSLDREENWDRIERSYRWLAHGDGRPVDPS